MEKQPSQKKMNEWATAVRKRFSDRLLQCGFDYTDSERWYKESANGVWYLDFGPTGEDGELGWKTLMAVVLVWFKKSKLAPSKCRVGKFFPTRENVAKSFCLDRSETFQQKYRLDDLPGLLAYQRMYWPIEDDEHQLEDAVLDIGRQAMEFILAKHTHPKYQRRL